MKLPKAVPILGEVYAIEIHENLEDNAGECDPETQTIRLETHKFERSARIKKRLNHELAHAFLCEAGLTEFLPDESQEQFAANFANFIGAIYTCEFHPHLMNEDS